MGPWLSAWPARRRWPPREPGAELYDEVLAFYASIPGRLLEVVLGAALLYHALNGLRIIIIDLWPAMTVYHRQLWWTSWIIFIGVGVPGALIILRPVWLPLLQQLGLA